MRRPSFVKAVEEALIPLGFEWVTGTRDKAWERTRGDVRDYVELQYGKISGVTANLAMKDLRSEELLKSLNHEKFCLWYPQYHRIGELMQITDKWWQNTPDGPTSLASSIVEHGMPFFEQPLTLADQVRLYRYGLAMTKLYLAVALYRLGDAEEACRVVAEMTDPRTVWEWKPLFRALGEYFGCAGRPAV